MLYSALRLLQVFKREVWELMFINATIIFPFALNKVAEGYIPTEIGIFLDF